MAEWNVVAAARHDFADLVDGLSGEERAAQSLCHEWSALDVAGHLVSLVEMSSASWAAGYMKNRKDIDGYISTTAKKFSQRGWPSLAQSLRSNAGKKLRPFSEASMVSDTAVHTLDVVRPLSLKHPLNPAVLRMALDFSVDEFAKKPDSAGVRFTANDTIWSRGEGAEVTGPAESLLLALNQRDVLDELDGPGVKLLG